MTREIRITSTYPHDPERVWRALTEREAISRWLMENDFEPRVGHRFRFRTKPAPGFDGVVHCEVLACDRPRRLAYSWRGGPIDTLVTFTLEPDGTGTRLTLVHSGFGGLKGWMLRGMFVGGWRKMLTTRIRTVLDAGAPASPEICDRGLRDRAIARVASWLGKSET